MRHALTVRLQGSVRGEAGEEEDYQVHAVHCLFTAGRQDEPACTEMSARARTADGLRSLLNSKEKEKEEENIRLQGIIGCIYTDLG